MALAQELEGVTLWVDARRNWGELPKLVGTQGIDRDLIVRSILYFLCFATYNSSGIGAI